LDCAPSTAGRIVQQLKAVLETAAADRLIARNPAERVKPPKIDRTIVTPLTVQQVQELSAAIRPDLEAAVILAATTGLRQGELFGLTKSRVHFLKREVVIDRQLITPNTGKPTFGPPKNDRSVRTVPLTNHAVEALSVHVEQFGFGGSEDWLFHRRDGRPLGRSAASQAFRAGLESANIEAKGAWHLLRHHAASVMIAQGLGVTAVAATLGHSPEETLRTYAAWWPAEQDQIRSAMTTAWSRPADQGRTAGGVIDT